MKIFNSLKEMAENLKFPEEEKNIIQSQPYTQAEIDEIVESIDRAHFQMSIEDD